MPTDTEYDEQDQSELFDEDRINPEDGGSGPDMVTFEELPDVYDATSARGDAEDDVALDADELEDEDLDELGDEDDEVHDGDDDSLDDELGEDEPEDNEVFDADDLDAADGVDGLEADEAELEYVGDTDAAAGAGQARARVYESGGELSNEDLQDLGYQDGKGEP